MQKSIFFILLMALTLTACQNEINSTNGQTAEATPNNAANSNLKSAAEITGETNINKSPFATPDTPQMDRVKRVLATNFWVNTAYFKPGDAQANRDNQGNWYQFNPDGTFTFGHFEKELAKGKWSFEYVENVGQVHLQAEDTDYSGKWNVKIGKDEDMMIWVGTEVYKTNNIQQRLENLLFVPKNRKELGMD